MFSLQHCAAEVTQELYLYNCTYCTYCTISLIVTFNPNDLVSPWDFDDNMIITKIKKHNSCIIFTSEMLSPLIQILKG